MKKLVIILLTLLPLVGWGQDTTKVNFYSFTNPGDAGWIHIPRLSTANYSIGNGLTLTPLREHLGSNVGDVCVSAEDFVQNCYDQAYYGNSIADSLRVEITGFDANEEFTLKVLIARDGTGRSGIYNINGFIDTISSDNCGADGLISYDVTADVSGRVYLGAKFYDVAWYLNALIIYQNITPEPTGSNHPRLFFDSTNIDTARYRWNNPDVYLTPVKATVISNTSSSNDYEYITANAFAYLMTGTISYATNAITRAYSIRNDAAGTGYPSESYVGDMDAVALAYDWCYDQLTAGQITDFQTALQTRASEGYTLARASFRYHEAFTLRSHAISSEAALYGDISSTSYTNNDQLMKDYYKMMSESAPDGFHYSYPYQLRYQIIAPLLWDFATNKNYADTSAFVKNISNFLMYKVGNDKHNLKASEGDWTVNGYVGNLDEDSNVGGFLSYITATTFNDSVAQWHGNNLMDGYGEFSGRTTDPLWLMFAYYNSEAKATSPDTANLPLYKDFSNGVNLKSDFYNVDTNAASIWIYTGPEETHSRQSQAHFDIWKGNDDLAIRGGNYLGTPADWNDFFGNSITRNTAAFIPKNSTSPDVEGGQNTTKINSDSTTKYYPNCEDLEHYSITKYRGRFINNQLDSVDYAITTSDVGMAYGQVDQYWRDFIYIKPALLIVHDRFVVDTSLTDKTRWIYNSRTRPDIGEALDLIEGYADSGLYRNANINAMEITKGSSKAYVKSIDPFSYDYELRGGGDYSYYLDGVMYNPDTTAQDWLQSNPQLIERKKGIEGQHLGFFERDIDADTSYMTFAIDITESTGSEEAVITYTGKVGGFNNYNISYNSATYDISLPLDNVNYPTVSKEVDICGGVNIQSTASIVNAPNGSIAITVTGGLEPYTYLWSNGETTQNISVLDSGNYSVTITDANGCTVNASYHIGLKTKASMIGGKPYIKNGKILVR